MDLERVKQLRNEYAEYAELHIISMEQRLCANDTSTA